MSRNFLQTYETFAPEDVSEEDDISNEYKETENNVSSANWMIGTSINEWHEKRRNEKINSIFEGNIPENPSKFQQYVMDDK